MASVDNLIEQHGEETIRKAFWLQDATYSGTNSVFVSPSTHQYNLSDSLNY
jgi:hypothetical protein